MLLNKPYWVKSNGEIEYFEQMELSRLKKIITVLKEKYQQPKLNPTYILALEIYNERLKHVAIPWFKNGIREEIGWIKDGKKYLRQKYHYLNIEYDDIVRNNIEKQFLMDTTIPIGKFKIKQVIWRY